MKWQKELCAALGLTGRIVIAHEGVNGTLSGAPEQVLAYKHAMDGHPLFGNIDFKESPCHGEPFPRMRIVVKQEIVRMGLDPQELSYKDAGQHLTPEQAHELISQNKELVILDGRNNYESLVGKFENAITPDVSTFREFPAYIDNNKELFEDKDILMYCTGGIRCERASAYVKQKTSARNVYQILGGIDRYAQKIPNGYFKGKNYVFDGRIAVRISDDVLAHCQQCNATCDDYHNCINLACNKQIILCKDCVARAGATCSQACTQIIIENPAKKRTTPYQTASCL